MLFIEISSLPQIGKTLTVLVRDRQRFGLQVLRDELEQSRQECGICMYLFCLSKCSQKPRTRSEAPCQYSYLLIPFLRFASISSKLRGQATPHTWKT